MTFPINANFDAWYGKREIKATHRLWNDMQNENKA